MEEEQRQEDKPTKPYKIMPGDEIVVYRSDAVVNDISYTFYYCKLKMKGRDGKDWFPKKELAFKSGVNIPNGTPIKVLKFFENARPNKNDPYNPIWRLFILDYDVVMEADAYKNEQEELESYQQAFY